MTVAAVSPAPDGPVKVRVSRDSFLLAAALFLVIATTNILTPLLPDIRADFGVSIATAGFIVGAYGLARLIVDLPAGFIADRVGHRRMSLFGLGLLLLASLVGLNADSVVVLIVSRAASGVAVGIIATIILTALSSTATATNRGKVMSLFHVANNIGIATYPLLGGVVGALFGWRATFAVTAVLGALAGVILLPVLRRVDPRQGTVARTSAPGRRVLFGRDRAIAIAATNVGVVANMVNRHGFRNTILPLYAATSLGLGGVSIASAIALMSVTGLLVATPGGMLGDRVGRRRIITAGLAAIAAGDLVFLFTGDYLTFLLAAGLIGFGDFFSSSQTALLSEIVPPEQRTRVLSGYRFSADLGAFVGPVALAAVMDLTNAKTAIVVAVVVLLTAALVARLGVPARVDI
ncbi:MAG TPA: MFS transporter [Candidatus Saccharimonadales bacterium]|nr:MFS transporter [Candidatus Saccharimonadales bacterium]